MLVEVTRVFTFDAAHALRDYVGPCADLHGHTYRLEVTVKGEPDRRGIVVDFEELKRAVREAFLEPFLDHRFLNETIPVNTTAENMVVWFFDLWEESVARRLPGIRLERVVLWETPTAGAALSRADWEAARGAHPGATPAGAAAQEAGRGAD